MQVLLSLETNPELFAFCDALAASQRYAIGARTPEGPANVLGLLWSATDIANSLVRKFFFSEFGSDSTPDVPLCKRNNLTS
jgi:hypothetical protein